MKYGLDSRFEQAARRAAWFAFRGDPDWQTKLCDVLSTAWEFYHAAPDRATPTSVATFAVRRVRSRRHFDESERSITGRKRLGVFKPRQSQFELNEVVCWDDNPADIAEFLDLYRTWFGQLNARQKAVVEMLAAGYRTDETAASCGVTPGRVSQIRREVEAIWDVLSV